MSSPSPPGLSFLIHLLLRPTDRLKPFTSYQFRVKATNDIGDSVYSEESEAITTLQDGEQQEVSSSHPVKGATSSGCCSCMKPLLCHGADAAAAARLERRRKGFLLPAAAVLLISA